MLAEKSTYIIAFSQLFAEKYLWGCYTSSLLHCFCNIVKNNIGNTKYLQVKMLFFITMIYKTLYLFFKFSVSSKCSCIFMFSLSLQICQDRKWTEYQPVLPKLCPLFLSMHLEQGRDGVTYTCNSWMVLRWLSIVLLLSCSVFFFSTVSQSVWIFQHLIFSTSSNNLEKSCTELHFL